MRPNICCVLTVLAFTVADSSSEAQPVPFNYTKIADTTHDPRFTEFHEAGVVAWGSSIAFIASGPGSSKGVYCYSVQSPAEVVANTTTPVPGGSGSFTDFTDITGCFPLAFRGRDSAGKWGIYGSIIGLLLVVADENTEIPNGTGTFTSLESLSMSPGPINTPDFITFTGSGVDDQSGIYLSAPSFVSLVADTNTPVPGDARSFDAFFGSSVRGRTVVFGGGVSSMRGIYVYDDIAKSFSIVATTDDTIPGSTGKFTVLQSPDFYGGGVVFHGLEAPLGATLQEGIYLHHGGSLSVIADLNTPVPGGVGNFRGFLQPSADGNLLAFYGESTSSWGIYAKMDGSLTKVVAPGDLINGHRIIRVSAPGKSAVDGNSVGFIAEFEGGQGVFVAEAQTCPTSIALANHAERLKIQRKLYQLRDEVLDRSESGRYFTWLFYRHAKEIRSIMQQDAGLRARTGNLLAVLAPKIAVVAEGGVADLSNSQLREIESLMNAFMARGSFELRLSLWWLRYGIPYRTYLKRIGFQVR
jgi:hypothetical protein